MNWGNIAGRVAARWRGLSLWTKIALVVFVIAIVLGFHFLTRAPQEAAAPIQQSHVHIQSVAGLSSATGPLPVTGKVSSKSQASILSQSSGEITHLYRALGDHVSAGQVIASFENSSQQAALVQAQGQYDAAQAALAKATGSTAANSGISSSQASQSAANAQTAGIVALQSTYAALDDAVHTKADTLISNSRTSQPRLGLSVPDTQLVLNINNERVPLELTLADAKSIADGASSANIDDAADKMNKDAQLVVAFLNDLVTAVNKAQTTVDTSASAIAADQTLMGAARTEVTSAISGLNTAKSSYDAAQASAQSAANSAGSANTNDISAAQASVKTAQGSLDAAEANLEKTVVRSPISGTIVSLPITQGDFVSQFSQVAQVSNPGALEIQTNVTPDDAKTLKVGSKATIEGNINGVITSIAPALDPTTNKIQVKIGITGDSSSLTDGETVTVSLDRANKETSHNPQPAGPITIPIISAKITPQGPVVFTLGTSSTLVAHSITLGTILGDQVQVLSGLTPDMDIVTDARGLSDGQTVVVDTDSTAVQNSQ
jgi:RND family efflux transporter MFP subunit